MIFIASKTDFPLYYFSERMNQFIQINIVVSDDIISCEAMLYLSILSLMSRITSDICRVLS